MYYGNNFNQYQQKNSIIWVQGIEGAKAYQLAPNSNVLLMDSEKDGTFYIKTCDSIGMCNLRIFNYQEVVEKKQEYVTKDELMEILKGLSNESIISTVKSNEQNAGTSENVQKQSNNGNYGNGKEQSKLSKYN